MAMSVSLLMSAWQSGLVGELLQLDLPQPDARSIRAAAIGRDRRSGRNQLHRSARSLVRRCQETNAIPWAKIVPPFFKSSSVR